MFRLTVTLIVAIYIVLIVVPGADHGETAEVSRDAGGPNWLVAIVTNAEDNAQRPRRQAPAGAARALRSELTDDLLTTETGFALETARGEVLEIAAVIDPVELLPADGPASVASISVLVPAPVPETASDADTGAAAVAMAAAGGTEAGADQPDGRILWRVTGSNVNFRAGPSTGTAVLAGLTRGDEVEFLGNAPDGWARLRLPDSGLEGFMAARFLEPVN